MEYTEQQEKIYISHVGLLKNNANPVYSERAIRELEDSYHLYCQLKNQNIEGYFCTKEEVWQELANLPIDDELSASMVEEIERRIQYTSDDYNLIMCSIIRLQIAFGVPIKPKYYSIFLTFFDSLYLQVISKRYRDRYQQDPVKVKTIGK